MTVSLKHKFVSAIPDGPDATIVRPSNWNDEHELLVAQGKLIGRFSSGIGAAEEITIGSGLSYTGGTLVVTSGGTGTVTSVDVSGSTTGLTFTGGPITTSGTITLGGTLAIANGGTGATTAQTAINALVGGVTSGSYLRGNGTNLVLSTIQAADVPTLNQNTTGTAANVTGTVAIANGGSGQTTANTALNAFLPSQTGNNGKVLSTDGSNTSWIPSASGSGTVTSVDGSGGTTGLTLTGGPITASGTLTLGGTLAIANGGTGAITQQLALNALAGAVTSGSYLRGDGTNVLMATIQAADVPTLNQNTTGTAANVTGTVVVANGGTGATTLTGYVKASGTTAMTALATIPSTDISGLGTMSTQNANAVAITGGAIDGTTVGATTRSTGAFTSLAYNTTLTGGTGIVNLGSGQFYKDASGNVGIGTASPVASTTSRLFLNGDLTLISGGSNILGSNIYYHTVNGWTTAAAGYGSAVRGDNTAGGLGFWTSSASTGANTVSPTFAQRMLLDANGNLGIGNTPSGTYDLEVTGSIAATGAITSSVATGTAPFVVASTTNVANLNASSLSGATFAAPGAIGGTTRSTGAFTTLNVTGAITSTLATGTAPFTVASQTNVANLNASFLNGSTFAAPNAIGGTTAAAITGTTITANTAFAGPHNGTVGATTPNTGAFTTLTASTNINSTRINPRIGTVASSATVTPTGDASDQYNVTALAVAATIAVPSGTPVDGQKLTLRIKDNGTARALTWTTSAGGYRIVGTTLPTTTVLSKTVYIGCVYNAADSFWDVIAVAQQA